MGFDEWKERQESIGNEVDSWSSWVFQQAKIDGLQKRIDVLTTKVNEMAHIFLDDLEEILKGESND